ncbi:unnamed protein product [Staurois parvus]|uniref:Uncharacterized protein n=1 Tax=Staurois parvus TaxID=386267 RepID=A0ABN9C010_9NEOB|nr:unnamed protein product [Staurois parvus]
MLTPSCPVSLVVSVLFISIDHCISVIGMLVAVSSPQCQNACRSPAISH